MSARPLQAQDKLAFLLSLVPYLIEHDGVAVSDAAAQFGVTPEEMRSAVQLIAISGIPGESRQYQPDDLFDINWDEFEEHDRIVITHHVAIDDSPRFSAREAAALIAGLQYLSSLPENADRAALASLTAKLASGATGVPSAVAVSANGGDVRVAPLREALLARRRVTFEYRSAQGDRERRVVDPLRIDSENQSWYLRGWDHSRGAVRTFRLDRISELVVTDEDSSPTSSEIQLPDVLFENSPDNLTVRIELPESALPLLGDYLPDGTRTTPGSKPGLVIATVRVGHFHGLKRLISGLSGVASVLDPPEARAAVADWAARGLGQYSA
jgi:proteasome accessory factor C